MGPNKGDVELKESITGSVVVESTTVSSASLQKAEMCKWLGEDITSIFSLSVCLML